jgi:hypothetical protein
VGDELDSAEEGVVEVVRRHRIMVAIGVVLVAMPLMGCALLNAIERGNANFEKDDRPPAVQLDTGEGIIAPESAAEVDESILFDNQNILAVQNGGTSPTFELSSATVIAKIQTYHWNDANGNNSTGTIALRADDGSVYGPWETVGADGQGGVTNAYWAASPNVKLPAGRYTVIDSDPGTWSQNADSGGEGFVIVYAQAAQ